jgi:hypothetical protein
MTEGTLSKTCLVIFYVIFKLFMQLLSKIIYFCAQF